MSAKGWLMLKWLTRGLGYQDVTYESQPPFGVNQHGGVLQGHWTIKGMPFVGSATANLALLAGGVGRVLSLGGPTEGVGRVPHNQG